MRKTTNDPCMIEPLRPLPTATSYNNVFNYSEYFIVRLKEYIMNINTKSKVLFILKILLLLNWDKAYIFFYKLARKYYALKIKKYLPRFSFYKTTIKRIEPALSSSKLPQIVHKYISDKSQLVHHVYENGTNNNGYWFDKDGVEFDHDGIHYYCYMDIMKSQQSYNNERVVIDYVLECSSNLSYDETIKKIDQLFNNFKPDDVYIYDGTTLSTMDGKYIKIQKSMENIFLQEDIEKQIKTFVSRYEDLKKEYEKSGILFKNTFLVYGKPGTGKSTLAKVIASELKRDIILFNLKDIKNIKQLQNLIHRHKTEVIVFEELDCLIERIKKRNEKKELMNNKILNGNFDQNRQQFQERFPSTGFVSYNDGQILEYEFDDLELSDFLEILDGMRSTEDSIIFFTTNHINKIDPAFKRQGRINYMIEMKLCNKYQLVKIYQNILKKEISKDLLDIFPEYKYSPSNVIETMLKNIFEIKSGEIDDLKLLELININHENFVATNNSDVMCENSQKISSMNIKSINYHNLSEQSLDKNTNIDPIEKIYKIDLDNTEDHCLEIGTHKPSIQKNILFVHGDHQENSCYDTKQNNKL